MTDMLNREMEYSSFAEAKGDDEVSDPAWAGQAQLRR